MQTRPSEPYLIYGATSVEVCVTKPIAKRKGLKKLLYPACRAYELAIELAQQKGVEQF